MVWVHDLRNELYHGQGALVPPVEDLDTARRAALWVFSILYDIDADSLLQQRVPEPDRLVEPREGILPKDMLFLESFVHFEMLLNDSSNLLQIGGSRPGSLKGPRRNWEKLLRRWQDMPAELAIGVEEAMKVRNRVVHGHPSGVPDEKLEGLSRTLADAETYVRQRLMEENLQLRLGAR